MTAPTDLAVARALRARVAALEGERVELARLFAREQREAAVAECAPDRETANLHETLSEVAHAALGAALGDAACARILADCHPATRAEAGVSEPPAMTAVGHGGGGRPPAIPPSHAHPLAAAVERPVTGDQAPARAPASGAFSLCVKRHVTPATAQEFRRAPDGRSEPILRNAAAAPEPTARPVTTTRDEDLRAALVAHLAGDPTARVRHETMLGYAACLDVLAVTPDRLDGYELKSEADTLRRLPAQVAVYGRVLDRVTLVCAPRHADKATALVPPWWGVALAWRGPDGAMRLESARAGQDNPGLVPWRVAELMHNDELRALLRARGIGRGVRSKSAMAARAAERLVLDELRAEVRAALVRRWWPAVVVSADAKEVCRG